MASIVVPDPDSKSCHPPKLRLEYCRACRDELPWGHPLPLADFILWGKLLAPEHFGPRCTDHAVAALGHHFLSQPDQWAVYDLRPLNRDVLAGGDT